MDMEHAAPVLRSSGSGGVDEMRDNLHDDEVQWGIVRMRMGSGAFSRHKLIFVHFNGEDCPAVKRGKANGHTPDVQNYLRGEEGLHASVEFTRRTELTLEELTSRVSHCFVNDNLGEHKVKWRQGESDQKLSKVKPATPTKPKDEEPPADRATRCPGHESASRFDSGRDALHEVVQQHGAWNWVLLKADPEKLPIAAGGSGSVDEMRECLANDYAGDVLFGLLRLNFGAGRLQRTKHVFVHAIGSQVPVVKRGRLNLERPKMERAISAFANCSVAMEVKSLDDLTKDNLIQRLRRAAVVDDEVLAGDDGNRWCTLESACREAVAEDKSEPEMTKTSSDSSRGSSKAIARSLEETVHLVRSPDGDLDWVVFGPQESWTKNIARRMTTDAVSGTRTTCSPPMARLMTTNAISGKPSACCDMVRDRSISNPVLPAIVA